MRAKFEIRMKITVHANLGILACVYANWNQNDCKILILIKRCFPMTNFSNLGTH